jgi:hypothetical protein
VHVNGGHRKHLEQLDAIAVKDDKVGFYRIDERNWLQEASMKRKGSSSWSKRRLNLS